MRHVAPARGTLVSAMFERMPLRGWGEYAELLHGSEWPSIDALNRHVPATAGYRFVAQTPALLGDGLHYEQRIAEHGQIATRERNWHDLLNAMVWLRYPALKQALNRRQVDEIARMGPKVRSRPQYAMTQFDEGGVIVLLRDPALLALWDAHDWHGLFWDRRACWLDGSVELELFGHALLELALSPERLLVGKAVVCQSASADMAEVRRCCVGAIDRGTLLGDPLDLRPLPLSGLPGWHEDSAHESFHRTTACYQPRREGRCYPAVAMI
jgi:hypothetical protein